MKDETSRIDIPIAGCRPPFEERRSAGPSKTPTPTKPPTRPSQTIGVGLGAIPAAQPRITMQIGTIPTTSPPTPESIYISETVPPPFPPRIKQAPIIKEVRQFVHVDLPI